MYFSKINILFGDFSITYSWVIEGNSFLKYFQMRPLIVMYDLRQVLKSRVVKYTHVTGISNVVLRIFLF